MNKNTLFSTTRYYIVRENHFLLAIMNIDSVLELNL